MKFTPRVKLLIAVTLLIFISLITFNLWQNNQRKGKGVLEIRKIPNDTVIYVNKERVSGKSLYLSPGKYSISGQREGFDTYTREVEITKGEKQKAFFVLVPRSDSANQWVKDNDKQYSLIENEAGIYYGEEGTKLYDKYPIMKNLPYRGSLYNIDYSLVDDNFKIQISSNDALGRQVAVERIKSFGFEPTDYDIEFLEFNNPFVNGEL